MGGGHHELDTFRIPKDHRIYDGEADKVPQLVKLKEKLAKEGLKDPWMRNEVFRYQYHHNTSLQRIYRLCGHHAMPIGIGLGIAAAAVEYAYDYYVGDAHHGDHHGEHH